ncbi:MAG TPA: DNA ligase D [Gammaproteobacteria bacterium]|nr:DNA ligase D [Gammaproteobacteria bacterium]
MAARKPKLSTYRAKRNFRKTAEPSGKVGRTAGHSYLIQKHAARRLHYDFRLEMGGVLKSWAVTKGPSLDPSDKRLAVHVEDHPLAYGKFEGTIPQGEYGGGTVMLWDKGSWEPEGDAEAAYAKGHMVFELHGERLKGRWHLVRMGGKAAGKKKENWLLIKAHDEFAAAGHGDKLLEHELTSVTTDRSMEEIATGRRHWHSNRGRVVARSVRQPAARRRHEHHDAKLPAFVKPQLATLMDSPPKGGNWVHEIKFDGYRLLARLQDGEVRLLTRAENDWTDKFGSIAAAVAKLPAREALLDGEVVCQEPNGDMSFHALQQALSQGHQDRMHYYLFDVLFLDGEDLRQRPLLERKEILKRLLRRAPAHVHYSEHYSAPGEQVLAHACDIALEGIVSKRADRPYHSGRDLEWLKSKCIHEQEVVIGGYTTQPKHPDILGAILTGYYRGGALMYSGKVGTGFNQDEARRILKRLKALSRDSKPFESVPTEARRGVHWVKPRLVAQVNFAEWTSDGRMRHPSFQGLREDKPAEDVVREQPKRPPPEARPRQHAAKTPKRAGKETLELEGVTLSHPDKVLFPEAGITKRILAEYYLKVAPRMLPHVAGRPISLVRCPGGLGRSCFFQRHAGEVKSPHLIPDLVKGHGDDEPYISIKDAAGLVTLVQMDVLEIHVWGSQVSAPLKPDRMIFDLDPAPDVTFSAVKQAAKTLRGMLKQLKLQSFLKTTGGKGLHVVVPFERGPSWDEVKEFSRSLAEAVAQYDPDRFTINSRKDVRKGKIYIDYLRNALTASAVAPYSVRAKPAASVAVPLRWEELSRLRSADGFGLEETVKRLRGDPWVRFLKVKQKLPL